MQEKRDDFERLYCVPQISCPVQGQEAIVSMTDEAIGLIDQHYKRLGGIYERRNGS